MKPSRRFLRNTALTVAALGVAAGTTVTTAATAQADSQNGVCETSEVCLYWGGRLDGAFIDFYDSQPSHEYFRFPRNGRGGGEKVINNVASVRNRAVYKSVRIFYNQNYGGPWQCIPTGSSATLNGTLRNENASHLFSPNSSCVFR